MCALFGRPFSDYLYEIFAYLALAATTALIMRYVDETRNKFFAFIRIMYPILMFGPLYSITGGTMTLLFDSFQDPQLTMFEFALLGFHPTIYIDQHLLNRWVIEILSFCYFAYYVMVPGFFFPAFFKGDYEIIKRALSGVGLTYLVSYLVFVLYPIEGPRWHFANLYANELHGFLFRDIVEWVIGNGAVRGGAMPSSHTGVALAIMLYSFKYYRPFGWIMLPIVTGLALGTIWGRFHYISDVVAGSAIALASVWIANKYYDRFSQPMYKKETDIKLKAEHVT